MIKLILAMQFALVLQWILRLAFSPMQLDFESAPFSHLGTSPKTLVLYQCQNEKSRLFPVLFYQFQNFHHFLIDGIEIFSSVRPQAAGAVFYAVTSIVVVAATVFTQTIQRTITEQTTEGFRVGTGMTGEIFTFSMLKKIIVRHICSSKTIYQ